MNYLTNKIVGRRIPPHSFRHAKVFSLLDQGWKIERVAAYMGHTSVQTTFQYVRLGPEEMRKEAQKVARNNGNQHYQNPNSTLEKTAAAQLKSLYEQGILTRDEYLEKIEKILNI